MGSEDIAMTDVISDFLCYKTILVLSGGKTGTRTLKKSLSAYISANNHETVIHTCHYGFLVQDLFLQATPDSRMLVINSFRDPISRMVSSFFENLQKHIPDLYNPPKNENDQLILMKNFMDEHLSPENPQYFESYHPAGSPPCFVSDAFISSTDSIDTLWLRYDFIHEWESIIGSILPGFVIIPDNLSETKHYYQLYKTFCGFYKNPHFKELIKHEKNIWQYYYTEQEMEDICRRWIKEVDW